jgi:hypothetical protein
MEDAPRFGLCDTCAHQQLVVSGRGSTFSLCRIGLGDPDWPKYPRIPVLRCSRYAARPAPDDDDAVRASTS